ncbi:Iron-sulfur cluster assembly 1 mitochondrial [Coelomomyces lativittatus]|nr:Iron-sulfur cluster assembly 1 mitochondrial [Coelomomyces lativittatus]KAJ1509150.1 Iron-sulfur cluster assembly 1 mitochondrial [Coelomomyces lativittatus]
MHPTVRSVKSSLLGRIKPNRSVLTLTPPAVKRIKELSSPSSLLRVGVKTKGCSGLTYLLEEVKKKEPMDIEVEQEGARILVESKALLSLLGSEVDYVEDKLSSQFVFHNPNIKESCGCGQSFSI